MISSCASNHSDCEFMSITAMSFHTCPHPLAFLIFLLFSSSMFPWVLEGVIQRTYLQPKILVLAIQPSFILGNSTILYYWQFNQLQVCNNHCPLPKDASLTKAEIIFGYKHVHLESRVTKRWCRKDIVVPLRLYDLPASHSWASL